MSGMKMSQDFRSVGLGLSCNSIKTGMSEFGVEELDWSAQSPDLNLIEHL